MIKLHSNREQTLSDNDHRDLVLTEALALLNIRAHKCVPHLYGVYLVGQPYPDQLFHRSWVAGQNNGWQVQKNGFLVKKQVEGQKTGCGWKKMDRGSFFPGWIPNCFSYQSNILKY